MSIADEIKKLSDLLETGTINQAEFERGKASILGVSTPAQASAVSEPKKGMGLPSKVALTVVVAVVAFLGYGFYIAQTPQGKQRASDRLGIEACWHEYKTKARDQATREFIAGACDLMEKKFESTHGIKP